MSVCIEGRRIDTKLHCQPFKDDDGAAWRQSAAIGSERLRHAILTAMGIDPGAFQLPPPVTVIVTLPRKRDVIDMSAIPNEWVGTVDRIQHTVAAHYKMLPLHMKSAQRAKAIARPRQIAMYLASELTTFSLVKIGKMFGNRDHTTVIHAVKAVRQRIEDDAKIARDVASLREALAA
jgi:hypothetical protein